MGEISALRRLIGGFGRVRSAARWWDEVSGYEGGEEYVTSRVAALKSPRRGWSPVGLFGVGRLTDVVGCPWVVAASVRTAPCAAGLSPGRSGEAQSLAHKISDSAPQPAHGTARAPPTVPRRCRVMLPLPAPRLRACITTTPAPRGATSLAAHVTAAGGSWVRSTVTWAEALRP